MVTQPRDPERILRAVVQRSALALALGLALGCGRSEDTDARAGADGRAASDAAAADDAVQGSPFVPELIVDLYARRRPDGAVVIEGRTNLPDGMRMRMELQSGTRSQYAREAGTELGETWLEVQDGGFTSPGLMASRRPFVADVYPIRLHAAFSDSWQPDEVIAVVGPQGQRLRSDPSPYLRNLDPEIPDGRIEFDLRREIEFPPLSEEIQALQLVRLQLESTVCAPTSAVRSAIERMSESGEDTSWKVTAADSGGYLASFTTDEGEALWRVDLQAREARYQNRLAKLLSCTGD